MSLLSPVVTGLGLGLLAGGSSCALAHGGLLAASLPVRGPVFAASGGRPGVSAMPATAAFLAAKVVSHSGLGLVLGGLGASLVLSPRARAGVLVAAGVITGLFALDLLATAVGRRLWPTTHRGCAVPPEERSRQRPWARATVLGFSTVLLPCGLTLSAELMAVASGSAVAGAVVMTGFVVGTVPLFAAAGFTLGAATRLLGGRLRPLVGIVTIAMAVVTVVSGLQLGGWLVPPATAGSAPTAVTETSGTQVIAVSVTNGGYRPSTIAARAGKPTVLLLHTAGTTGCTQGLVIPALGQQWLLPERGDTQVDLGSPRPGVLAFTCTMGMYSGRIDFRPP